MAGCKARATEEMSSGVSTRMQGLDTVDVIVSLRMLPRSKKAVSGRKAGSLC